MSTHWRRRRAEWTETVGAAMLGAGVGLTAFYLTRLLLAREPLEPPRRVEGDGRVTGDAAGERSGGALPEEM